jgi:hypothetical protein
MIRSAVSVRVCKIEGTREMLVEVWVRSLGRANRGYRRHLRR